MLIKGKSKESFNKNVETEMHSGKPLKQSLAIAYATKRKAMKKMRQGGLIHSETPEEEQMEPAGHESHESAGAEAMEHDLVSKIMHKRKMMAEGGLVANDLSPKMDEHSAEYDYLVEGDLDDHSTNSGAADGDFLGNEREDHDRHDIVAKIMKKRGKQHNPRPA